MVTEDRPSDPLGHATAMVYRTHAPLTKHMTMEQRLVSFGHLHLIATYAQVELSFVRTIDNCTVEMCRASHEGEGQEGG